MTSTYIYIIYKYKAIQLSFLYYIYVHLYCICKIVIFFFLEKFKHKHSDAPYTHYPDSMIMRDCQDCHMYFSLGRAGPGSRIHLGWKTRWHQKAQ